MGGAGGRRLKNPYGCKALPGGVDPETEARQAGLALFSGRKQCRANGMWVPSSRKAAETFWKGKPPKGESHERRRCETKPARDSRE
jgi:hypothetical protein